MAKTGKLVVVTGFKELDAKLRNMPPALQRKFVRGGLRKGTKRLIQEAKRIIKQHAYDTGAFHDSLKAKALKRSRKRVGVATFTDTSKLYAMQQQRRAKRDLKRGLLSAVKKEFFYPAIIEFGDEHHEPVRPLRKALYDNANIYRDYFRADLTQFIADNKVTAALPKVQK